MITHISPREAELSRQVDALTAELARLRAVEPVAWYDDDMDCAYTASELDGGTADGLAPLYRAAPPAQPAEPPPGWVSVPVCLTPEMREVLLMADRFTVGEVYIMLLAAAPKATK